MLWYIALTLFQDQDTIPPSSRIIGYWWLTDESPPPTPAPPFLKELSSSSVKESLLAPGHLQSTDSDTSPQKKNASQGLFHIQNFCEID